MIPTVTSDLSLYLDHTLFDPVNITFLLLLHSIVPLYEPFFFTLSTTNPDYSLKFCWI